jgi:phage-related protein
MSSTVPALMTAERPALILKSHFCYISKMAWTVLFVNPAAQSEVRALPLDMQAHFARLTDLFRDQGLGAMREPYAKHLAGKLWELRLRGRDGIARSIYVTASGQRVVVLRTFVKKTEKTPPREIGIAQERAKEIEKWQ